MAADCKSRCMHMEVRRGSGVGVFLCRCWGQHARVAMPMRAILLAVALRVCCVGQGDFKHKAKAAGTMQQARVCRVQRSGYF
jgi:hypothetical protein